MKRPIMFAALALGLAACDSAQDPTSVGEPQAVPQMAVHEVTVLAKGKATFAPIWSTFSETASWNTQTRKLTFSNDPETNEARYIGWKKNTGWSYGTGVITWTGSNGVEWFVDLSFLDKQGNYINRVATRIRACKVNVPTTCKQIKLYW